MTNINLLPWRELKRERDKKQFIAVQLSALIGAVFIVLACNWYSESLVDGQSKRNQKLKDEIASLDIQILKIKQLKELKTRFIARTLIINGLQATRALTVHLFDELIKVLPDGVYLTNIKRTASKVIVQGYSESNSSISQLMRNIQNNLWIQEPELTEIKKNKEVLQGVNNEFILSFILKPKTSAAKHE